MINPGQKYTLTYSDSVKGFPSFYSFYPEKMIGMNNLFYTFKGGNLFRHNTNEVRNEFYGVQGNSTIKSVINQQPLENKLFKTLNIEGDDAWEANFHSDQQTNGYVDYNWFEKKEGAYFAFLRTTKLSIEPQLFLRSINGIGTSLTVEVDGTTTTISFPISLIISEIINVGDSIYFDIQDPSRAGVITEINQDYPGGINNVVIDNSEGSNIPTNTEYIFSVKDAEAESNGVLGHYGVFELINTNTEKIELFAVQSEVMKSFP